MLQYSRFSRILLLLVLCLIASNVRGDDQQDAGHLLQSKIQGKIFTLKTFDRSDRLYFKSDGTLVGGRGLGPWTLYANVEVSEVLIHGDRLEIQGNRIFMRYDDKRKELVGARASKVSIEIEIEPNDLSSAALGKPLRAVFLAPGEKLADRVPSYWRQFLETGVDTKSLDEIQSAFGKKSEKPPKSADYDIPPKEISAPSPDFSDEARRVRFQGSVLLSLIVNEEGKTENIVILKPLGMGLDEKAVETVQNWKFKPAMREGVPASVKIKLQITFRM